MIEEENVRADMTFGATDDLDVRQLRARYDEALRQLAAAQRHVDNYREEATRLGWENATLKHEVEKKRMQIDILVTRMASKPGDA